MKEAEANEEHKGITSVLRAAALFEFEQINFVVGNYGSVVKSDCYTKLKNLMYTKKRKTNSSPIM